MDLKSILSDRILYKHLILNVLKNMTFFSQGKIYIMWWGKYLNTTLSFSVQLYSAVTSFTVVILASWSSYFILVNRLY